VLRDCDGTEWYDGYLRCQARLPEEARIPLLVFDSFLSVKKPGLFSEWYSRWKPDAIISVGPPGRGESFNKTLGFASLTRLSGQTFAGVSEGAYNVGRAVVDCVVARIFHGDYGYALSSKKTVISGTWVAGDSVTVQPAAKKPLPGWVVDFLEFNGVN